MKDHGGQSLGGLLMVVVVVVVVEKVRKNECLLLVPVPRVLELDTRAIEGKERSRRVGGLVAVIFPTLL